MAGHPSVTTIKTLFALSGNTCAYVGCEQQLTDPSWIEVNADIAHICGERPGSPRYEPTMTDAERHSFENLMVLCPGCHRRIDRLEPALHPAELLREMKSKHEGTSGPGGWAGEDRLAKHAMQALVQHVAVPPDELEPIVRAAIEELRDEGLAPAVVDELYREARMSGLMAAARSPGWEERAREREDRLRAAREERRIEERRAALEARQMPTWIMEEVAEQFGVSQEELIGTTRSRNLVTARQVAMFLFRDLTELSYPAIARHFGNRDHTTVIHAVEKVKALMGEQRAMYETVTGLLSRLRQRASAAGRGDPEDGVG